MKKNKTLILTTVLCLLPLILSAVVYNRLPDQMAIHWGTGNTPNGYTSKFLASFGLPLFLAVLNFVGHVVLDHDPRRTDSAPVMLLLGKWIIPVISLIVNPFTLLWNLGYDLPIDKVILPFIGILFIICGNYLPKCRQNYTIGIKLPWTLNSEENWNRTHHLAGYLWIICGILMLIFGLLLPPEWIIAVILVIAFIPSIYSFFLYTRGI